MSYGLYVTNDYSFTDFMKRKYTRKEKTDWVHFYIFNLTRNTQQELSAVTNDFSQLILFSDSKSLVKPSTSLRQQLNFIAYCLTERWGLWCHLTPQNVINKIC